MVHTLDPWLRRIEKAIVKDVLLGDEQDEFFPQFNVDGLLRGDYKSRMEGYSIGRTNGWMSANDIRRLENFDLIPEEEGGDEYIVNGSCVKLKDVGAAYTKGSTTPDQPESQPTEPDQPDPQPEEEDVHENKRHTERHEERRKQRR